MTRFLRFRGYKNLTVNPAGIAALTRFQDLFDEVPSTRITLIGGREFFVRETVEEILAQIEVIS